MAKNLSHDDWMRQQFAKYLRHEYRDVLIHASIIEGTVRNESKEDHFGPAIATLRKHGKIGLSEFRVFSKMWKTRNRLVHSIVRKGLAQSQIDGLRDKLMEKILEAYRSSSFLDRTLFSKYRIVRVPAIIFTPPSR